MPPLKKQNRETDYSSKFQEQLYLQILTSGRGDGKYIFHKQQPASVKVVRFGLTLWNDWQHVMKIQQQPCTALINSLWSRSHFSRKLILLTDLLL